MVYAPRIHTCLGWPVLFLSSGIAVDIKRCLNLGFALDSCVAVVPVMIFPCEEDAVVWVGDGVRGVLMLGESGLAFRADAIILPTATPRTLLRLDLLSVAELS